MRKNCFFTHFLAVLVFVGCVAGEGGKSEAECSAGLSFDSVSRSCQGAKVIPGAPNPITNSVSILEDSGLNHIQLQYSDFENDFATSCEISTGTANGYIKKKDIEGLKIISATTIDDPHNTVVTFYSVPAGVPAGINNTAIGIQIGSRREIRIGVEPSATSSAISAAIAASPTASPWVTSTVTVNQVVSVVPGEFFLDEVECHCFGGVCRAEITPTDNFNGTTEFFYRLGDNDGVSATTHVRLNITSLNDAPVVTVLSSINATEKYDHEPITTHSASGNLITGGVLSANDINDGDPLGLNLSYQLVTPAVHGTVFIDALGNFTYNTTAHQTTDSFTVRAVDLFGTGSTPATVNINITTVDDPPVGTVTSLTAINEDGSAGLVTLTYEDEEDAENDSALKCVISSALNSYPDGGCFCAAGVCRAIINTIPNRSGVGSFSYKIYDNLTPPVGGEPQATTATFAITSQLDNPVAFPSVTGTTLIQGLESETFVPSTYNFTLDGGYDEDGSLITSYTLVTAPTNGSITGCLGSGSSGLNCTYTPNDGNLADTAILDGIPPSLHMAQVATDSGTFYASTLGTAYNGVQVELKNIRNLDESINTLFGANAVAYSNTQSKVTILFQAGLTNGTDIQTAINANPNVSKLVSFDPGVGVQVTSATLTLGAGVATADSFVFRATDSGGASSDQTVHISLIPVDDRPTICEYSNYAETTVCGLNGCIGNASPNSITPDQNDLIYYSSLTGSCFKSSGGTWSPVESFMKTRTINELDPIVIDNIKIDEGGGTSEDSETLSISDVDSSDESLVPLGNIEIFFDNLSTPVGTGATAPFTLTGSGGTSADAKNFRVVITPQTINPADPDKSSEIEITVADSSGKTTEVTFTVNVQKVSAAHGGWVSFSATGPKVDSLGLVNEDRKVCPYSLDQCESGGQCFGSTSPINNSSADPDNEDAIYMQQSGSTINCFRQKRVQVQNIAFIGKTSSVPTITYVEGTGASANTASVSVSGSAITVTMYDDFTTTDTIITAIQGNASANALVKAINLKATETQDNQALVSLSALSNASWESFTSYCSVTPAALEPGCAVGGKTSCIGFSSPSGTITPTKEDSRYWDEEANVCYRSTGTTSTSWETYDAPSEIKVSWNQFTVNGSASISEYRVFRRLANEEFDFSKPINRSAITGSTTTYTYVDNATNSVTPPSPGTVYYYVVRPVVNGILTSTAAETGTNKFGIVRMLAPPKNMAFAHRWMINKRICEEMNRSSDPTQNYRCLYKGPGDITVATDQYYDYGKDLLIDRFEAGCPYSSAPACPGTFDNSCIGVGNPNTEAITPTAAHKIYYSRSEGKCYYNQTGTLGNWVEWDTLSTVQLASYFSNYEPDTINLVPSNPQFDSNNDKQYHRSSLPPLTNLTQANANSFCGGLEDVRAQELLGINSSLGHRLPTRKDQVAYSLWDSTALNDSEIAIVETGFSLNSASKCNGSAAAGLEDGYVDFDKPDSNDFYSLPGTDASGIRSLTTGSNETAACTSAFGVQDAVGNVSEWTSNGFNCPHLSQCFTNETIVIQGIEIAKNRPATDGLAIGVVFLNGDPGVASSNLAVAGITRTIQIDLADITSTGNGVAAEINAVAGTLVTARVVGDGSASILPFGNTVLMGLELASTNDTQMRSSDTTDNYGYWSFDGLRGPCSENANETCASEITSWAIEDKTFQSGRFLIPLGLPAHTTSHSAITTSYDLFQVGATSGIINLALHDDTVNYNTRRIASEASGCGGLAAGGSYKSGNGAGAWNMEALPCSQGFGVVTIGDVTFKARNTGELALSIRYVDTDASVTGVQLQGSTLMIDIADAGLNSASGIATAVVVNGSLDAFVSGDANGLPVAFTDPITFPDLRDDAVPSRIDVGFRCLLEVPNGSYDE